MPRKTVGYLELEWTCPNCKQRNPGSRKTCTSCGSPQPESVAFEQARRKELLKDAEKAKQAAKGADIHCPFCGTRNPVDAAICSQCGGDLKGGKQRQRGRVVGAYAESAGPVQQIACPTCGTANPETNLTCSSCGARLPTKQEQAAEAPPSASRPFKISPWLAIPLGILLLVACVVGAFILFRTEKTVGVVRDVGWELIIPVEAMQQVTREDWRSEIPAQADILSCQQEHRYTQDQPAPNAVEVCGTPYVVDTGSGYGEVVQDCQYEIYEDYCEYAAMDWQVVDELAASGNDNNPYWPQANLGADQREGERSETYTVVFSTESKTYTYTTSDAQLFSQLQPGTEWTLVINTFGEVVDVQP